MAYDPPDGFLRRIAVGFLAPAPTGALVWVFLATIENWRRDIQTPAISILGGFVAISLYAYWFVWIQSAIYTVLMETIVNAKVRNDAYAVLCSVLLGAAAGVFIYLKGSFQGSLMAGVGACVGLVIGLLLRRMYKAAANRALERTLEARR